MTIELFQKDSYQKEAKTEVKSVEENKVILDKTIFYPTSGGQPNDTGTIVTADGNTYKVDDVQKSEDETIHLVDKDGLKVGEQVTVKIDWQRRYIFMRYHTAMHILTRIIEQESGAKITGNQITEDYARVDFNLENYDKAQMMNYAEKFNQLIQKEMSVNTKFLSRDEALQDSSLFTLKDIIPKNEKIRIVEIEGFDKSACGGTHVSNTNEIGEIEIFKLQNKGKSNRRLYFRFK